MRIVRPEEIDRLLKPLDEDAQERVVELAKICADNPRFEAYCSSVAQQLVPKECAVLIDPVGLRMIILGTLQMGINWAEQ